MDVALIELATLRADCARLARAPFIEQYPGAFLLAMGFLSAQAVESQNARTARQGDAKARTSELRKSGREADATTSFSFGNQPKHEQQPHPLAGRAFFVRPSGSATELVLGRGNTCSLVVPDTSVSEMHCRIRVTERGVVAIDVGSTNGTKVNLQRLTPGREHVLADEDILTVGRYSFQLLSAATLYRELSGLGAV